jgi:hypothetical protein
MRLTKTKLALRALTAAFVSAAALGVGMAVPADAASTWRVEEKNHTSPKPKDSGGKDASVTVYYKGKKVGHAWFDAYGEHFTATLNGNAKKATFKFQYYKGTKWKTAMSGTMDGNVSDTHYATWGWDVGPHWWIHDNGYNLKEGRPTKVTICSYVGSSHRCASAMGTA